MMSLLQVTTISFLVSSALCINKTFDPNLNMCIDGVPNAVVTMADRSTYIFKGYSYWQLTDDFTKVSEPKSISDNIPGLPVDLDLGFTIWSESSKPLGTFERTLFAKNAVWYQVYNNTVEQTGNTSWWFPAQRDGVNASQDTFDLVMTQLNDSVATIKGIDVSGRGFLSPSIAMVFDDFVFPDSLPSVTVQNGFFHRTVRTELVRSSGVYLVPTVDNRFLIFAERRSSGYFCLLDDLKSPCTLRDATELFPCPANWSQFKSKNFLARIYYGFGVSSRLAIVSIIGLQIGAIIVLFALCLLVISKVGTLWKYYTFHIT
ncbi:hypothetical protein HDE_05275 [Halotydeus destructor]|nr:hypothetical protein HDE_05275 [Halotydeus destructor]